MGVRLVRRPMRARQVRAAARARRGHAAVAGGGRGASVLLPWFGLEERLDVLEHEALGLGAHKVHEHAAEHAHAREEEEDAIDVERGKELDHPGHAGAHDPVGHG